MTSNDVQQSPPPSATVVVGVDGSAESRAALEYAVDEAILRNASVYVLTVFESVGAFGARYGLPIPSSDDQIARRVHTEIRALVDEVLLERVVRPVVRLSVRAGWSAAHSLVTEAEAADLLVVGHRGLGGFASAVLGSVSLHCVLHARCPVVVVRRPVLEPDGRVSYR